MTTDHPLVAVLTPVYNGEKYLAECIESVLAQTYHNWDYTIVNNCSTDKTLEIAQSYAKKGNQIKVVSNSQFVGVIENHNIAFRLISPSSKYCKVVSADDWLFPECITRMVELAEANPSVGIVGSYALRGGGAKWEVVFDGLPHYRTVVPGRDICRSTLLGGRYVFGIPTSTLYRSDLVRNANSFYPNSTPYADVSAYYEYLQTTDFGFVHQVLSYERVHAAAVSSNLRRISAVLADMLRTILEYGPIYLTKHEFEIRLEELLDNYYRLLAEGFFNLKDKEFWNYHKRTLEELGYHFYSMGLAKAICVKLLDLLFNPKQTIEKAIRRLKAD
jgi:glycosyltransferase involved in cell wall biosynthesis